MGPWLPPQHLESEEMIMSTSKSYICFGFTRWAAVLALGLASTSMTLAAQERVTIKTINGHFVTAVNGGGVGGPDSGPQLAAIHTDATAIGSWETFTCARGQSNTITFQTNDGHFLTAVNGGGIGGPNGNPYQLHTDASQAGPWEQFTLVFTGPGRCALRTNDGRYVSAVNRGGWGNQDPGNQFPIHTNATQPGPWETFTIVPQ
jgi:hypothetical protein